MPYITLDKAALAFGHVALLDQVDFQLDEGERVGLIGRNGGGKSSPVSYTHLTLPTILLV